MKTLAGKVKLLNCVAAALVFCLTGGLMQIVVPQFADAAVYVGIGFFAVAGVLGVVMWRLSAAVRKERTDAPRENAAEKKTAGSVR